MNIPKSKLKFYFQQILLFVLFTLPTVFVANFSYNQLYKELTEQTYLERQALAKQMALTVESRLDAIQGVNINSAGHIATLIQDGEWEEAVHAIEHVSTTFPYIDRIFITDEEGVAKAFYPPSPENLGKDFKYRDWYIGVSKNWEPYVSEVFKRAPQPQFNTVGVVTPIKDETGKPIAVLGFAVNLDSFYQLSNDFKIDKGAFLYIINHKGQIIAHPRYDSQGPIVDFTSVPVVQKILKGERGAEVSYNPVDQEERLAAYDVVSRYGWGVIIADRVETAFSVRDTILRERFMIYGVFIVLTMFLTGFLLRFVSQLSKQKSIIDSEKTKLQALVDNLPIGVSVADAPSGKLTLVNKAGTQLLGKGFSVNVGKEEYADIYKVTKSDGSVYPTSEMTPVITMQSGQITTKEDIIVNRPDESKIQLKATSVPIRDASGELTTVVSIFEDVTKAKEIDRMKTEFISLASHQLRTPLSAIKWFGELLLDEKEKLNEEQLEYAQNISISTERMIELVNSLLNISRIESGRIIIDPVPTNLGDLANSVVKELEIKFREKEQLPIVSIHRNLPSINIDPNLIRQVFINLLTNAIKYSPKQSEISVFVSKDADNIICQITDSGYGIPQKDHDRVFVKFYRGENIIKEVTEGNGLGLYLVKSIIDSSGGKIWFESEPDKGTTFWFSLPLSGSLAKQGEVSINS